MIGSLKKRVSNNNNNSNIEIETLQNALQEAMLRERQLIQEKAQREDEMKQQREATKQFIEVLMKEKKDLQLEIDKNKSISCPPSIPPPLPPTEISRLKQLEIEAKQNKKDLQRVLQKLSQREHEHNQFNEEILKLKISLKEKINENIIYRQRFDEIDKKYRMTADKLETAQQKIEKATNDTAQFHETQTLLQSITNELRTKSEKMKIIQQEKENLRDELTEKKEKISNLNKEIEINELKINKLNATINELKLKLDSLSKKGKLQIDQLIDENIKYKENINNLNIKINENTNEYLLKNNQYKENINNLNIEIDELNKEKINIENQYKEKMEEKTDKINELEIEYKIRDKKKNKLIRELQDQLKKEVIKSQELKCKVLNLNDDKINTLNITNRINNGSFVEKEVSGALAKKLEIEVKSNYALKEQIKYLTQCIQQLHIDLDNKKDVINNLTKRIDIGAIPINHTSVNTTKHNTTTKQLQLLLQETTLQNSMLRKDLKLMGNALQESNNKIKQLTNCTKKQNV